jgi:hypothetical protein
MPSRFGWVDFAEEDRQRMLDVVQLFREQDTRDELGIGTIRDAFANYFFPGTSTIQTRARYMLFVPWIYLELERKRVSSAKIADRARGDEIKLIYALLKSEDTAGLIGKQAKSRLQRLPSSIYWAGLGSWGIRQFPGLQYEYHRSLDAFYTRQRQRLIDDDREPVGGLVPGSWHPGLPGPPDGLLEVADFALTQEEAGYLRDRILARHPDSLLAVMVCSDKFIDADFIWHHPILHALPGTLYQEVKHARNFSETIHGAALLYNLMLAHDRGHEEWIENYQMRLNSWSDKLSARWHELATWYSQPDAFWSSAVLKMARIPYLTRAFVNEWLRLVFDKARTVSIVQNKEAQMLIHDREVRLKRARARLENPRALELWPGASGDSQLDFRWTTAMDIVNDILYGLYQAEDTHA